MKSIDIYQILLKLNVDSVTTNDVCTKLNIEKSAASKSLRRLALSGYMIQLKRGLWCFKEKSDLFKIPQILTAPFPSYISLQTALYLHGMISQMSSIIYAVSIARTQKYVNALGTFSIHHIQPDIFRGYEQDIKTGINLATPEKALFDFCYLNPAKSHLFHALPELELPDNFRFAELNQFLQKIQSEKKRKITEHQIEQVLKNIV